MKEELYDFIVNLLVILMYAIPTAIAIIFVVLELMALIKFVKG